MRILSIVPDFYPSNGGYSNAITNLYLELINKTVVDKVLVYTPNFIIQHPNEALIINRIPFPRGIRFILLGGRLISSLILVNKYRKYIKKIFDDVNNENIKLVIIETIEWAWIGAYFTKKLKIPVVIRLHGASPELALGMRSFKYNQTQLSFLKNYRYLASTTPHYFRLLANQIYGIDYLVDNRLFVIPNLVIKDHSRIFYKQVEGRRVVSIIQLGRMDRLGYYQKGFDDSLRALYQLDNHITLNPLGIDVVVEIIGTGGNSNIITNSISRFNKITVRHSETVSNDEVLNKLGNGDIVLLTSRIEGQSMFGLEAISHHNAVIAYGQTGLDDLVVDGTNGFVIRKFDYYGLYESLVKLLYNLDLMDSMKLNSYNHWFKRFSTNAVMAEFEYFLDNIKS